MPQGEKWQHHLGLKDTVTKSVPTLGTLSTSCNSVAPDSSDVYAGRPCLPKQLKLKTKTQTLLLLSHSPVWKKLTFSTIKYVAIQGDTSGLLQVQEAHCFWGTGFKHFLSSLNFIQPSAMNDSFRPHQWHSQNLGFSVGHCRMSCPNLFLLFVRLFLNALAPWSPVWTYKVRKFPHFVLIFFLIFVS